MKIRKKIFLGFSISILITGALVGVLLTQQAKMLSRLYNEIPSSLQQTAQATRLDSLAQFIRYYDEVLTQAARNYAFTQNPEWKERYLTAEPKLDEIIKASMKLGSGRDLGFFSRTDKANRALVEMEHRALEAVGKGQSEEAIKILESSAYKKQKVFYVEALKEYKQQRGIKYDEVLSSSAGAVERAIRDAQQLSQRSVRSGLVFTIILAIVAFGISFLFSKSITRQIYALKNAMPI